MLDPHLYSSDQLRKVAKLHYDDGLKLEEIRDRLSIELGRPHLDKRTVEKMLSLARTKGIVRIDYPVEADSSIESELKEKFPHLQRVIAVPDEDDYGDLLARWGQEAARYFDQLVSAGSRHGALHIGISGGETLLSFANAVAERPRRHVHIHTTALIGRGELGPDDAHVDPLVNAQILWSKCGHISGHCHYATVPPYDGVTREQIPAELHELSQRKPIKDVIDNMDKIEIAFAGLGLIKPFTQNPERRSQISMTGLLRPIIAPEKLEQEGAVGDLAYCLFDAKGNTRPSWEFFLTGGHCRRENRGIEFFKQMVRDPAANKKVVVIAGHLKTPVIMPH